MGFQAPVYTAEEIRKWKELIYGPAIGHQVDDWVSSDQGPNNYRRKGLKKKGSNTNRIPSSLENEWLSEPKSPGRNYRSKRESRW